MARGRLESEWQETSYVAWMIYAVNAGRKAPRRTPSDFNPFARKPRRGDRIVADGAMLYRLFMNQEPPAQ